MGDATCIEVLVSALKDLNLGVRHRTAKALDSFGWQPANEIQNRALGREQVPGWSGQRGDDGAGGHRTPILSQRAALGLNLHFVEDYGHCRQARDHARLPSHKVGRRPSLLRHQCNRCPVLPPAQVLQYRQAHNAAQVLLEAELVPSGRNRVLVNRQPLKKARDLP